MKRISKIVAKQFKLIVILTFINFYCIGYCQDVEPQKEQEEIKEGSIYTSEQEKYMGKWFTDNISEMNLSDEEKTKYNEILIYYTSEMGQLNKNEYSDKELKQELNKLVELMNSKMETILTKEQYKTHVDNFKLVLWNVYLRKGWD